MSQKSLNKTRKLMQALLNQPPKRHQEMKLGRKRPQVKAAAATPHAKPKNV